MKQNKYNRNRFILMAGVIAESLNHTYIQYQPYNSAGLIRRRRMIT